MAFWRNYYHLTWTTKNRLPLIRPEYEHQLYSYMVKKVSELDVFVYAISGTEDHLHVIAAIPPKQSVAQVVKLLKGASSHYVNHVIRPNQHFEWQRGYGCLTVGEKQRSIAENYVRDQKRHHAEGTTNSWLEGYAQEDAGPNSFERRSDDRIKSVRDEPGDYDVSGNFPF